MSRANIITQTISKVKRNFVQFQATFEPKFNNFVDKYKIVKVGCTLGILLNSYYIYDGALTAIVLKQTQRQINQKRKVFDDRMINKKTKILHLLQELQNQNAQNNQKKQGQK